MENNNRETDKLFTNLCSLSIIVARVMVEQCIVPNMFVTSYHCTCRLVVKVSEYNNFVFTEWVSLSSSSFITPKMQPIKNMYIKYNNAKQQYRFAK